ncbi:MAG: hypothetical protein WDO73_01400 [Ignavibacteriota bacterium]
MTFDAEISALRLQTPDLPHGVGAILENAVVPLDDTVAGYVFRSKQGRVFSLERRLPFRNPRARSWGAKDYTPSAAYRWSRTARRLAH